MKQDNIEFIVTIKGKEFIGIEMEGGDEDVIFDFPNFEEAYEFFASATKKLKSSKEVERIFNAKENG